MHLYERFLQALIRSSLTESRPPIDAVRVASEHPRARARRRWVSVALGIVVPIAVGLCLIPLRDELGRSIAMIFVLPTLFIALARGPLGAVVSAVVSAAMYNFFLTSPYLSMRIDASADIVTMLVLFITAAVVGVTSSNLRDMTLAASTRRGDVDAFVAMTTSHSHDRMIEVACGSLVTMLGASSAQWRPGYHGTVDPVLHRDGTIAGKNSSVLPPTIEIPATVGTTELGRFIVRSGDHETSREERRAALSLVDIFALLVRDRGVTDHART